MHPDQSKNISVLIITLNEETHMQELLSDLVFADEVIIVDSYSVDRTKAISESFSNVRFIEHKFENYTLQRNFAIDQARNNWILFLDADERLTTELKQEIIETINQNTTVSAYLFYRKFMFNNEVLHFSGWQTDRIFRLFDKRKAKYTTERLVHEKLEVKGEVGVLKNKLIHFSYSDYDTYKGKMESYGKFKAQEKFLKKSNISFLHPFLHPTYNFLYNYIVRLGILDGKKGIIICYLNAYSVYIRYQELKKMKAAI